MQARKRKGYLSGSVTLATKRRNEPVWELRYRIPSGKQSSHVLGKAWQGAGRPRDGYLTLAQAQVLGQRFLDDHSGSVPDDRRSFGRACEDFLRYIEVEKRRRGTTLHEYKRIANKLAGLKSGDLTWGERPLDTFCEDELIDLRNELIDAGRSNDTLNHYRRVLRGIFGKESYGRWILPGNSVVHAWAFKSEKQEAEGMLRHYAPDEVEALLAATDDPMDIAIWTLATQAGPRQSEIRALLVRNVDFRNGLIVIEHAYTDRGGLAGPKSHKIRSIPMSPDVRRVLAPYCAGKSADDLVFVTPLGGYLDGWTMFRRLQAAAVRAGLPVLRFHDLRHTYGTFAASVYDLAKVQHYMGHADIKTTMRYVHFVADPEAASEFGNAWAAATSTGNVIPLRKAS